MKKTDIKNCGEKTTLNYSFYSRVLEKPFDSIDELCAAEQDYFDKLKAKEDKAAQKKADATAVEDAFKALNAARKTYRENLSQLTTEYSESLDNLKKAFELGRADIQNTLAKAEDTYSKALKDFTNKYPEGYHLTLKDGDFETTISSQTSCAKEKPTTDFTKVSDILAYLFNNL
jgi:chromosome segregation ATPase